MKNITLVTLSFLVSLSVFAGNPNNENYRYKVAKKVYDDLIQAKGDRSVPAPTFEFSENRQYGAYMDYDTRIVGLEVAAYDVCKQFGVDSLNALAALLAHEVIHYYQKHTFGERFVKAFHTQGDNVAVTTAFREKAEGEADYLGIFLAYTAGYDAAAVMPDFLKKVYEEYGLPENLDGYPTLFERQTSAIEASTRVGALLKMFDAANYFVALNDHDLAAQFYNYILRDYQSKQLYNNVAVNATMAAMKLYEPGVLKYAYPIELDANAGIRTRSKGDEKAEDVAAAIKEQLELALTSLKSAITLDEDYATSHINMACVYQLMGKKTDATFHADKAIELATAQKEQRALADALTIRGIIYAESGDKKNARIMYRKAASYNDQRVKDLVTLNEKALDGEFIAASQKIPTSAATLDEESIDGVILSEFVNNGEADTSFMMMKQSSREYHFGWKDYENSTLLIYMKKSFSSSKFLLHITRADYGGETLQSIRIGDSRDKLVDKKAYGNPDYTVKLRQGYYVVYLGQSIIFQLDENQKVVGWVIVYKS